MTKETDEKEARQFQFECFLSALNSRMVHAVSDMDTDRPSLYKFRIELHPDPFIEPGQCPRLSDAFYTEAERLGRTFMGQQISWNNNQTTGWFYFPEEAR